MARLVPFLAGLSHARLDREGGLQWPCPTAYHPGTRYLYAESFPRGKGRFIPAQQTAPAAELPDATPREERRERLQRLQALLDAQARAVSEAMVGGSERVLVEGPSRRNARELAGRTGNNRVVNFAGPATRAGGFARVRITEARSHTLRGELADGR